MSYFAMIYLKIKDNLMTYGLNWNCNNSKNNKICISSKQLQKDKVSKKQCFSVMHLFHTEIIGIDCICALQCLLIVIRSNLLTRFAVLWSVQGNRGINIITKYHSRIRISHTQSSQYKQNICKDVWSPFILELRYHQVWHTILTDGLEQVCEFKDLWGTWQLIFS